MSVSAISAQTHSVYIKDGQIVISHLRVANNEAASLVDGAIEQGGAEAAADLIRRALPVGLVALNLSASTVDTSSVQRTLAAFHDQVEVRSRAAVESLDLALQRMQSGDAAIASVAQQALDGLPAKIEAVLSGEALHVRQAVTEAARQVQATGLQEIRGALTQHGAAMRDALSLDREGPVQVLRRDLLNELSGTRRELAEQLTAVRGLLQAAEAANASAPRTTRAAGEDWESHANSLMADLAAGAGDRYSPTGSTPAPGGTRRSGDGLVHLTSAITGPTREVSILVEAKRRARPLTVDQWRRELSASCDLRSAAGALALVPGDQVPGGGPLCRVNDTAYVVAADDPETVRLVFLLLREVVALLTVRQHDQEIDLTRVEAQVKVALTSLAELDEVARLCRAAQANLAKLLEVGGRVKSKIHEALTNSLEDLNP
jgi:hypothetical protein